MTEHERNLANQSAEDPFYEQAVELMRDAPELACISRIQRKLLIGYNRASRIMDAMIERGVIARTSSAENGVKYTVLHAG